MSKPIAAENLSGGIRTLNDETPNSTTASSDVLQSTPSNYRGTQRPTAPIPLCATTSTEANLIQDDCSIVRNQFCLHQGFPGSQRSTVGIQRRALVKVRPSDTDPMLGQ